MTVMCVFVVCCVQYCMRAPPSCLEPAQLCADTPTTSTAPSCRATPSGLNIRLGVCKNCRKFYKAGEVRDRTVHWDEVKNTIHLAR
jgi:hypothetical protein